MGSLEGSRIELRPTRPADLERVCDLERDPENAPFIGQWSRAEHLEAIDRRDRFHLVIECPEGSSGGLAGYLIAYDLGAAGLGVYVKRSPA